MQRDDQRVVAQDHGHGFGRMASPLLLENADRLGDLLRHGWIELFHGTTPWMLATSPQNREPTQRITRRRSTAPAYSLTSLPAEPGCSLSSRPTTSTRLVTGAVLTSTTAAYVNLFL